MSPLAGPALTSDPSLVPHLRLRAVLADGWKEANILMGALWATERQ